MKFEVRVSDDFEGFYDNLADEDRAQIDAAVLRLRVDPDIGWKTLLFSHQRLMVVDTRFLIIYEVRGRLIYLEELELAE